MENLLRKNSYHQFYHGSPYNIFSQCSDSKVAKKNYSVNPNQSSSESLLKDIRRNTKQIFTSGQKILIGKEDIRGEHSIAEIYCKYLYKKYNIKHIHGKLMHLQMQGKIERYHSSIKNVIKLNHYFYPSEQEKAIDGWVKCYNERRFHESLANLHIETYI